MVAGSRYCPVAEPNPPLERAESICDLTAAR